MGNDEFLIAGVRMKTLLAFITVCGFLSGIDALQCYSCDDLAEAPQNDPEDKTALESCSEDDVVECEEGDVCVSLIFHDDDAYSLSDEENIVDGVQRKCGPAVPEQSLEEACQDYKANWKDLNGYSFSGKATCTRETCETELCNTHGSETLQGPAEEENEAEDTRYSSGITRTISTLLATVTALRY